MTRWRFLVALLGLVVALVVLGLLQIDRGKSDVAITVVFNRDPRATLPQVKAAVGVLERDPKVKNLVFVSANTSLAMSPHPLPPSAPPDLIRLTTARDYESKLESRVLSLPGVESVNSP